MAADMFIKIDGITGEAKDATHSGEIDLIFWNWTMTQSGTMHSCGGGGSGNEDDINSAAESEDAREAATRSSRSISLEEVAVESPSKPAPGEIAGADHAHGGLVEGRGDRADGANVAPGDGGDGLGVQAQNFALAALGGDDARDELREVGQRARGDCGRNPHQWRPHRGAALRCRRERSPLQRPELQCGRLDEPPDRDCHRRGR